MGNENKQNQESELIKSDLPCLDEHGCGSSDALALYDDGHSFCFSCGKAFNVSTIGNHERTEHADGLLPIGRYQALKRRGISADTCRKYSYFCTKYGTEPVQVGEYRDRDGKVSMQQLRYSDKRFLCLGNSKNLQLYGQHLWAKGGKSLIICEGEIDTLTWAQVRGLKWPVVGVPGAAKMRYITDNIDYLSSFEEVYIYTDMDDPGRKMAREIAELLPPGLAKIGNLPEKDVHETYIKHGSQALYNTLWQALPYAPIEISAAFEVLSQEPSSRSDYTYPLPAMQTAAMGQSFKEIVCVGAGTSVGKSTMLRYLAWDLLSNQDKKIGYIPLEETSRRVLLWLMSYEMKVPVHTLEDFSQTELEDKLLEYCPWHESLSLYTHRGANPAEIIFERIRYMAVAQGCKYIFIDHISAIFASMQGDERKEIDKFMYALQDIAKELDILIFCASHLKDPMKGKPLEEGGSTSLSLLRGSGSIRQVCDTVWGLERNSKDSVERLTTKVVSLKQRFSANTGDGFDSYYSIADSRLAPREYTEDDDIDKESTFIKRDF